MSVGQTIDKATVDAQIASFPRVLNDVFGHVQLFAPRLDAQTDAQLVTAGYPSGTDVATLRSAYRDLEKTRQLYQGTGIVQSGGTFVSGAFGYDQRTFTK